jgi:acetylornithine/succinyldiaminopimelate/putrescine aminotransferase
MTDLHESFLRHVAQTSTAPMGLEVVRAEGSWLYSADGRRYLDLIAGIGVSALGHGHPAVLEAIAAQSKRYLHVMVYGEYVIEAQVRLAERLAALLPPPIDRIYFTNSGAEAVEGALKTARKHTRRERFIAFDGAYHGDTMAALSLMGNPSFRAPFEPLPGPVTHLPYDDSAALEAIDSSVAAVIIEPVQAEAGVRIPSREFMQALRDRCKCTGALLIYDEVLTGMGRTGRLFAMAHFNVVPDIVVLAKALGGGLPLGAFCGSSQLIGELSHDPPLGHITTFGGHPLSCAAGLAMLDVIVTGRLWNHADAIGQQLVSGLRVMMPKRVEIRGIGALVGVEFHDSRSAQLFVRESLARGVIINWTLNAERVVRLAPPLTISAAEAEFALRMMSEALEAAAAIGESTA